MTPRPFEPSPFLRQRIQDLRNQGRFDEAQRLWEEASRPKFPSPVAQPQPQPSSFSEFLRRTSAVTGLPEKAITGLALGLGKQAVGAPLRYVPGAPGRLGKEWAPDMPSESQGALQDTLTAAAMFPGSPASIMRGPALSEILQGLRVGVDVALPATRAAATQAARRTAAALAGERGGFGMGPLGKEDYLASLKPQEPQITHLDELSMELASIEGQLEGQQEIVRPHWASGISNDQLIVMAKQEGRNPYTPDWGDSLDPKVITDAKHGDYTSAAGVPTEKELRGRANALRLEIKAEEAHPTAPTAPAVGQIQAGMGIGENPTQGQLLGEFQGKAPAQTPLVDAQQVAARAATTAQEAAGQARLPTDESLRYEIGRASQAAEIGPRNERAANLQRVKELRVQRRGLAQAAPREAVAGGQAELPGARSAATEANRIDSVLGQFETTQAAAEKAKLAAETEEQYVARRLAEHRADAKATGFRLDEKFQRTQLRQEYRAAKAAGQAPGGLESAVPAGQARAPQAVPITEEAIQQIVEMADETKKAASIGRIRRALAALEKDAVDGASDVEQALNDYQGIVRKGMTPEDYVSEKEAAWEAINDALGSLTPTDLGEPPFAIPPEAAARPQPPAVSERPAAASLPAAAPPTTTPPVVDDLSSLSSDELLRRWNATGDTFVAQPLAAELMARGINPLDTLSTPAIAGTRARNIGVTPPVAEAAGQGPPAGTGAGGVPPGAGGAPPTGAVPPTPPDDALARLLRQATPGETPSETLLRRHAAVIRAAENEASIASQKGSLSLKVKGIGEWQKGRLVPRAEDIPVLDKLNNALHNPSKKDVLIPKGFKDDYQTLRTRTNWEEAARIDFDPEMAQVEDYFYRGWLTPKGASGAGAAGRVGVKPPFKKPRVDATYTEMRDAGFEPLFWNPYEQERFSHMMGVKYRQQIALIDDLKQLELAVPDPGGVGIVGWRTPKIGPAFEGKPFATTLPDGTVVPMFTKRWVVPDEMAARLENIYGVTPNLGSVHVAGKTIDIMKAVDTVAFLPKRVKLFGSVFQQRDFLQRNMAGTWAAMVDELRAGKPISALTKPILWPRSAYRIIEANVSPGARLRIQQQLNSITPILRDRPGVHFRGIMEGGLSTIDPTILPSGIDKLPRLVATENGLLGRKAVARAVAQLESAMRRGLFNGVYPAAQITSIENFVAPVLARRFPQATDEALNGMIARLANTMYSTIPAEQSIIQNQAMRTFLTRAFFSLGENEALLRQATGALRGPYAAFWRTYWLGSYLSLIAVANTIHWAATGKPLPWSRYSPVSKTDYGPLPVGYNRDFAAPDVPIEGRSGTELTLDLVGQMDTAFRILDPTAFITARESVPVRAGLTQITGRDFYDQPVDDVGPGGIVSRTVQLASDLFSPIGPGQAGQEVLRAKVPALQKVLPEGEARLGVAGNVVQGTGLNLRAETSPQLRERTAQETFGTSYAELEPYQRAELRKRGPASEELRLRRETTGRSTQETSKYTAALDEIDTQRDATVAAIMPQYKKGVFGQKTRLKNGVQVFNSYAQIQASNKEGAVQAYRNAERDARVAKDRAAKIFKIAFDDSTQDPVLTGYYALFDKAAESGVYVPAIFSDLAKKYEAALSTSQKQYLYRNTNLHDIPDALFALLDTGTKQRITQSRAARAAHRKTPMPRPSGAGVPTPGPVWTPSPLQKQFQREPVGAGVQ